MTRQWLTDTELKLYVYMQKFFRENDQLPTLGAIGEELRVNGRTSWALRRSLERKGYLERNEVGKYRFRRADPEAAAEETAEEPAP